MNVNMEFETFRLKFANFDMMSYVNSIFNISAFKPLINFIYKPRATKRYKIELYNETEFMLKERNVTQTPDIS